MSKGGDPQATLKEAREKEPEGIPWGTQGTTEEIGRTIGQETRAEPRREPEEQRRNKGREIWAGTPEESRTKGRDEALELYSLLYTLRNL